MNILLISSGFILAFIIVLCYECKIRRTEPMNKVHFYITRDKNGTLNLWLGKPCRDLYYWFSSAYHIVVIAVDEKVNLYGLNIEDYDSLK